MFVTNEYTRIEITRQEKRFDKRFKNLENLRSMWLSRLNILKNWKSGFKTNKIAKKKQNNA